MDPVTLIVAALVAGTVRSVDGVADQSLKDAYAGLKGLLKRFFKDRPAAEMVLEEHGKDPATYVIPLEKHLLETGAAQDAQVLEAAQKLLAVSDPEGTRGGVYKVGAIKAVGGSVAAAHIEGGVHMNQSTPSRSEPDPS